MVSVSRKNRRFSKTRKTRKGNAQHTPVDIVNLLMELKHSVKVYHWTTDEYRIHIATDGFLKQLDPLLDQYTEVMLGLVKKNMNKNTEVVRQLKNKLSTIQTHPINDIEELNILLNKVVEVLKTHERISNAPELLAIRDELVGETQKFKYLIAFKE
jgi:hypothetical protein